MKTSSDKVSVECVGDWTNGWYNVATRVESPNHGSRPVGVEVDLIVVHSISLPPGEFGGDAVHRLFTNTLDWDAHPYFQTIRGLEVSAHFFIDRHGRLTQFVDCDLRAWHAGASRYRGRPQCNDDSIGIELEGLEGLPFEQSQYETLAGLCRAIAVRYPIGYVAGHEHIAPDRKKDPGDGFDWPLLQQLSGWPVGRFPAGTCNAKSSAR
jgi:AmpD protein